MNLSKLEQETIILFNEEESTAEIDTCNKALINRLDGFCNKSADIVCTGSDEHGKRYILPKKWVKVNMPRQISEETRAKYSALAKANLSSKFNNADLG